MSLPLSPMARRALALAILLLGFVAVWSAAVGPALGLARDRLAEIARLSERVEQAEAIIARRPELEQRTQRGKAQLASAGGLWTGASAAAAAAAVQDRIREAVSAGGGRVSSISEMRESVDHGFRRITLRFRIEGSLDTALQTMAAIATSRPALFADTVTITVPENTTDRKAPPVFDLDLEISGYLEITDS